MDPQTSVLLWGSKQWLISENSFHTEELDKVNEWFSPIFAIPPPIPASRLQTDSCSGNKHSPMLIFKYASGSTEINRVVLTKFLGVIISSNLKWNKYIDSQSTVKLQDAP